MDPIYCTKIVKIKRGESIKTEDTLVREIKLDIVANGQRVGALMATPIDQEALALGYLMSEGVIRQREDVRSIALENDGMRVVIEAKIDSDRARKLDSEGVVISGCGRSSTANIDPDAIEAKVMRDATRIPASLLSAEMERFYTECPLYEQTGCVHTAKLFLQDGSFTLGEDIAQHNTIDKAIGKAHLEGKNLEGSFLMVSGRLSSEMVAKAVMHSIPILASRTASTCLGVQIARKFGLTLIGFVRQGRMNIYANERRIDVPNPG